MTGWRALDDELDAWAAAGRTADFWWRDDDAHVAGPALDRLLDLAAAAAVPVAVAVVPMLADRALAAALDGSGATVLQHGYAHANFAPDGAKRIELGPQRPAPHVLADLAVGHERLADLFGPRALPVLVPPWNRIAPVLVPMLPEIGYRGLSRYLARQRAAPVAGLVEVNAHVDIVDWKAPAGIDRPAGLADPRPFAGEAAVLAALAGHLGARRRAAADPDEPTGLLTHHLVHDDDAWNFVAALLAHIGRHPAVRWRSAVELFAA
jgi:hypothetical protein